MDTLTHIVLGSCIGEVVAGKVLGKKALLLGAIGQSIPDVDFIPQMWLGTSDDLLAHRGFTHSILFGVIMTLVLSVVSWKIFPNRPISRVRWLFLFSINIFSHVFIDTFNAYGTGWFEPFSHNRFSFHVLYVADPFFSVGAFLGFVFLLIAALTHKRRKWAAWLGISLAAVYLVYALVNKLSVDEKLRKDLADKNIPVERGSYILTPSPFNTWLWYTVIKDKNGFWVGYRSVFDHGPTSLTYFPKNDSLLINVNDKDEVEDLLRFAGDFYTVENSHDTLVFNVLRFGQVVGWYDPHEKFTFHYFLDKPGANHLIVQRGRFEGWNRRTFRSFINRIKGN
ncbi:metal-dependent hydrolase [Terrimonas pollutisoli]|uniref:metal-dependent hydrolase n=1 Tax=Terrimonas pollutisoli TaxID=3034147 RepID=UPI0023EC4AC1|nr:metal-dependent hydrolase [Terrimonas sp. H1YJ31]